MMAFKPVKTTKSWCAPFEPCHCVISRLQSFMSFLTTSATDRADVITFAGKTASELSDSVLAISAGRLISTYDEAVEPLGSVDTRIARSPWAREIVGVTTM